jgi:hypothetical protein
LLVIGYSENQPGTGAIFGPAKASSACSRLGAQSSLDGLNYPAASIPAVAEFIRSRKTE